MVDNQIIITPDDGAAYVNHLFRWSITPEKLDEIVNMPFLLPPQVRWMSWSRNQFLLEFPPTRQRITAGIAYFIDDGGEEFEVEIPLPWTVYFYNGYTLQIFARASQIRSLDDELCWYHLSNIQASHEMCDVGEHGEEEYVEPKDGNSLDYVFRIINRFWQSKFNGGMYLWREGDRHCLPANLLREKRIASYPNRDDEYIWIDPQYFKWLAEQSVEDLLEWEWQPSMTIRELILPHQSHNFYAELNSLIRTKGVYVRQENQ